MKKIFAIVLALTLFASCKNSQPSKVTVVQARTVNPVAMVVSHPNYCLAANGNINSPSGPIQCLIDFHIDDVCVAAARTHYISTVRAFYTLGCSLARQYEKDHDIALGLCGGTPSCIANADASLETNLTNLDNQINANITAAISTYWAEASACCVPDGH